MSDGRQLGGSLHAIVGHDRLEVVLAPDGQGEAGALGVFGLLWALGLGLGGMIVAHGEALIGCAVGAGLTFGGGFAAMVVVRRSAPVVLTVGSRTITLARRVSGRNLSVPLAPRTIALADLADARAASDGLELTLTDGAVHCVTAHGATADDLAWLATEIRAAMARAYEHSGGSVAPELERLLAGARIEADASDERSARARAIASERARTVARDPTRGE